MNNKALYIVEMPSNLGLKAKTPETEPGVKKLPGALKKNGFYDLLEPQRIFTLNSPPYAMDIDRLSGVRNANAIVKYAKQQAGLMKQIFAEDKFAVVLGGDCSILIGNALALKQQGRFGLFYLDGHTDFMGVELSETKAAAGMDLAIVTGWGHEKLTNIDQQGPYLKEDHIWCVGNRELDADYVAPAIQSAITYYDLYQLRKIGIEKCVDDFLIMVDTESLDGYFIHFDVDVLADVVMPAVDSRQDDGLSYEELIQLLQKLLSNKNAKGIEITILDPDLDPTERYTKTFAHTVGGIIKHSRMES